MALFKYVVFHPWRTAIIVATGLVLGLGAFYLYQVTTAFGVVASEDFDPGRARVAIRDLEPEPAPPPDPEIRDFAEISDPWWDELQSLKAGQRFNTYAFGELIPDEVFEAYLLLGSDLFGLADVIILFLQPTDGADPIMVSLPRDLYVWNVCRHRFTRINEGLGGCREVATGPEMMAIMVEDYTGIPIDHLARVDFSGFARLVDVMGGTAICVNHPTRDRKAHLDIPTTGCRNADGATTLAWVRSRQTQQFIDGRWVTVAGSDFARQARQQDVLFQMAGKMAGFASPTALADRLNAVSSVVRLDSGWTFGEAVSTAWRYRGLDRDSVSSFQIVTIGYRAPGGAAVLLPTRPFKDQLEEVYVWVINPG